MDEILASIRKIIESNELDAVGISRDAPVEIVEPPVATAVEVEPAQRVFAQPVVAPPVFAVAAEAPQQAAFADVAPVSETVSEAPKSMSLADIAARVRSASEQRYAENTAAAVEFAPLATPAIEPSEPEPVRVEPRVAAVTAPVVVTVEQPAEPVTDQRAMMVHSEKVAEPLLSNESGEHVARSFSDLAAAISSSPRRSFDEIAEDMLRPMLTEWLDDNLPKLVERLVREEIERVARGPRR